MAPNYSNVTLSVPTAALQSISSKPNYVEMLFILFALILSPQDRLGTKTILPGVKQPT